MFNMSLNLILITFSLLFMGGLILFVMNEKSNVIRIYCPNCDAFDWKYERMLKAHICQKCNYKLKDITHKDMENILQKRKEELDK